MSRNSALYQQFQGIQLLLCLFWGSGLCFKLLTLGKPVAETAAFSGLPAYFTLVIVTHSLLCVGHFKVW